MNKLAETPKLPAGIAQVTSRLAALGMFTTSKTAGQHHWQFKQLLFPQATQS